MFGCDGRPELERRGLVGNWVRLGVPDGGLRCGCWCCITGLPTNEPERGPLLGPPYAFAPLFGMFCAADLGCCM